MGKPHGREYRFKLAKADGAIEYSDWFNTNGEAMEALRRATKVEGCKYYMQEKNVFNIGESGDHERTEYPISTQ